MKFLLVTITVLSFTQVTYAGEGQLDGMKFCRSISTGGMFGQPRGIRLHCLSFNNGKASDNASTFFGNAPEIFSYSVQDAKIIDTDKNRETSY